MFTDISIILDSSGSMDTIREDTIGGFNSFIKDQKQVSGDAVVTLALFNHDYEVAYEGRQLAEVPPLNFHPNGGTALLDAIGRSIETTKARLISNPADQVILAIITDGQENSSSGFSLDQIKMSIEDQTKAGWTFVFLGANQNAFTEAGKMGIGAANTLTYAATDNGMKSAFSSVSRGMTTSRTTGVVGQEVSNYFIPEDQYEQDDIIQNDNLDE